MKKILIAIDYNPTGQKVAEIGFSICENQKTEITLLHVIGDPSYYSTTAYDSIMGFSGFTNVDLLHPEIISELNKSSLEFLEKTKKYLCDETIKILVKEGSVAETILEAAEELNSDFIVLGSHSKRWLENILMGSITEYVLHHTTKPLFIIPTKRQS